MGKHSAAVTTSNRRHYVVAMVGLLVLSLGGFFVVRSFGSDGDGGRLTAANGDCAETVDVSLTTAPELKPQLEAAAKSLAGRDDSHRPCATFKISTQAPSVVAAAIAAGDTNRPDLWIPDSSLWVARADDGQSLPTIAVPSVATTPLVLVGAQSAFANTSSWLSAFQNTPPRLLDPLNTSTGLATLIAIQAERVKTSSTDAQVGQVMVPLAQKHGSLAKPYTDLDGLFGRAAPTESGILVPAPEQAFVAYQEKHPEAGLKAAVPTTGTIVFDYPMVVTATDDGEKIAEAAKLLSQEMLSEGAVKARDQAGFRSIEILPLEGGRGVGEVNLMGQPQPQIAEKVIQTWSKLALSSHSLVVIDISGSMQEKVPPGNRTRMDLAVEAAEKGLELFPESAQLGLWAFSTAVGSRKTDWFPQLPIRPLGQKVNGRTQKQQMVQSMHSLKSQLGGGTGLYDTTIAAYRSVQDSYDTRSINTVIIFTDGRNEDPNGISLNDALSTLQRLRDPARPVRVIAIGMGPDASENELASLARATGGRSYLARNPSDIQQVFIDAIQAR
jgi:hypothetical protein